RFRKPCVSGVLQLDKRMASQIQSTTISCFFRMCGTLRRSWASQLQTATILCVWHRRYNLRRSRAFLNCGTLRRSGVEHLADQGLEAGMVGGRREADFCDLGVSWNECCCARHIC
ncbi:MAG: hypothetical protein AAGG68_09175, partial [Bacteroidota bacterium]